MNLRRFLSFLERRKHEMPVAVERRHNGRSRYEKARDEMHDAIGELDRTVRTKREDLIKRDCDAPGKTVIFSTYRDICPQRGPELLGVRYCRHPEHPDKEHTSHTICEERKCPRLFLAMRGLAA